MKLELGNSSLKNLWKKHFFVASSILWIGLYTHNFNLFWLIAFQQCLDSSVGRASDWRSEGPVFDSQSRHNILLPVHCNWGTCCIYRYMNILSTKIFLLSLLVIIAPFHFLSIIIIRWNLKSVIDRSIHLLPNHANYYLQEGSRMNDVCPPEFQFKFGVPHNIMSK